MGYIGRPEQYPRESRQRHRVTNLAHLGKDVDLAQIIRGRGQTFRNQTERTRSLMKGQVSSLYPKVDGIEGQRDNQAGPTVA